MGTLILKQGIQVPLHAWRWRLKKIHAAPVCCLSVFLVAKKLLDLYFHPSITEFRIEGKMHAKAVTDVTRGDEGRFFLFSWERIEGGQQEPIVSTKARLEDLNMKFRSKFNHDFTTRGCLFCTVLFYKLTNTRQEMCNFSFKMFKMSFSRF